jgi:hypothetical protein
VRAVEIIIILPFSELLIVENDVIADAPFVEELIELLVVDAVRALDFAVEPRGSRFNVYMFDK